MRDPRKPYPTDYLLKYTVLPLIPRAVTPNQVTVLRIVLTPVVVWFIIVGDFRVAIPLFLFVALTDAIDGAMARLRAQITQWGTLWDPVADKLLIGSAVVVVVLEHVNLILGLVLLALELIVIIAGYRRYRQGIVHPANVWGKTKMVLEVLGVTILLIALASHINLLVHFSFGTFALAIIFAVVSLLTQSH